MPTAEELQLLQRIASLTLAQRQASDPLRLWQPLIVHQPFIQSVLHPEDGGHWENWFVGANRCLTPWTCVETGSATRLLVEMIGEPGFDVQSWDGASRCTRRASPVFLRGIAQAFRFHLDNGEWFESTYTHRVLTPAGWLAVGNLVSTPSDQHYRGTVGDCQASYDRACCRYDPQLLWDEDSAIAAPQKRADAPQRTHSGVGLVDVAEPTLPRIHSCLDAYRHSTLDDPRLLLALCDLWTSDAADTICQSSTCGTQALQRSPSELAPLLREQQALDSQYPHACHNSGFVRFPWPILLVGGSKLIGYQKIGLHPILDFTVEGTHCYWTSGAIHHNCGKTSVGSYVGAVLARQGLPEPVGTSYSRLPDGTTMDVRDKATAGWVLGLDSNTNRDIIQPRYFDNGYLKPGMPEPFIPEREIAKWEVEAQILKLRNGSFIGWKSGEQDALKVAGGAIDWLHGDEPPKKPHYDELLIRIGAGRRFRKFFTATILPPQGHVESISWVYQEILEPIIQGRVTDVGLFQASIYDNPHLSGEEIQQLESRYPLGSLSRRIRLNGEILPGIAGAVAYGNFARGVHVRPLPPLSPHRPLCWAWDFNVSPFCTSLWQVHPDQMYCYDEIVLDEGNIDAMLDEFERRYPRHPHELWIYGDANGGNRSHTTAGKPRSSYDLILARLQRYPSPVKMKVPAANPLEVDRLNAMNAAFKDAQGASHILIDPKCTGMIRDFEQVLMDPHGGIKKTYNHRDPYSQLTHLSDGAGYLVITERPVRQQRAPQGRVAVKPAGYGVGAGR